MTKQLFTINEVSKLLGVSIKTLRRWDQKGLLSAQRTIGNQRRYALEDIEVLKGKKVKSVIHKKQVERARQVTIAEAAAFLGISVKTLRRWEAKGIVASHRSPTNQRFFLTNELGKIKDTKPEAKPIVVTPLIQQPVIETPTQLFNPTHSYAEKHMRFAGAFFSILGVVLTIAAFGISISFPHITGPITRLLSFGSQPITHDKKPNSGNEVLATETKRHDYAMKVSIPAEFLSTASVSGKLTAPNILYSVVAGDNITISGDRQNPTISANVALNAGNGINTDNGIITNTDTGSSQKIFGSIKVGSDTIAAGSNTDSFELAAGSNVSLSTDVSNKKITISSTNSSSTGNGLSGMTTDGVLYATSDNTATSIDAGTAGYVLQSNGSGSPPSWVLNSSANPPFSSISDGTNTTASMVVGPGASLTYSGGTATSGVINANELLGGTWAIPGAIGATTANSGAFTTLSSSALLNANGGLTVASGQNFTLSGITTNNAVLYATSVTGVVSASSTNASGLCLISNAAIPSWQTCPGGTAYWDQVNGALTPKIETVDLLLGSQATTSAKFAFINVASGTPTASISGTNNNALSFDGNGNITTTNKQSLTLGNTNTGNIVLSNRTVANAGLTVPNGQATTLASFTNDGGVIYADTTGLLHQTATGNSSQCLIGGPTPSWSDCSGAAGDDWNFINGALSPKFASVTDLLLGSTATSSAEFAITGISAGSPVATLSATANNGYGLSLNAASAQIQSLNKQTLTIGGASTGNISLANPTIFSSTLTLNNKTISDFVGTGLQLSSGVLQTTLGNSVNLATQVNGILPVANGGTGADLTAGGHSVQGSIPFFNGSNILTSLVPSSTAGYVLTSGGASADPSWVNPSALGTNYWDQLNGVLTPKIETQDLLLGSSSTGSAKFAFINVAGGTPTASISGTNNNALSFDGNGTIGTTNRQNLTLGNSSTGNIVLANGGFTQSGGLLYTNGAGVLSQTAAGSSSQCLIGGPTPSWNDCGAASGDDWNFINGALSPKFASVTDLLLGSSATNSAQFALTGIAAGTPTASLSATTNNNGLSLNASNSQIQSLQNKSLTIGGDTTGNIILSARNGSNDSIYFSGYNCSVLSNGGKLTVNANGLVQCSADNSAAGAGTLNIKEGNSPVVNSATDINFAASDFNITPESPTQGGVAIDYGNSGIVRRNNNEVIGGQWSFLSDLLVGGTSTSSAKFAVLNMMGAGTPTASLSGSNGGAFLTANGQLQTTNSQPLTLGGGNTGGIILNGTTTLGGITYTWPGSQSSGAVLQTNGSGTLSWVDAATLGTNYWDQLNGVLTPKIETQDLLLGSQATSSARFAVINVAGGTPVASLSGSAGGTFLTANGQLQTTNNQSLTLSGGNTGNVVVSNLGTGVVHATGGVLSVASVTNAELQNSLINLAADSTTGSVALGGTFTVNGTSGQGISTSLSGSTLTITAADATAAQKGVASFTSPNFSVTSGAVSIATGGVGPTELASSGVSLGTYGNANNGVAQFTVDVDGRLTAASNRAINVATTDITGILGIANGGSPLESNNGSIFERISTQDLLLGSNATTSAKFAFINVAGGTPTASISGTGNNDLSFDGNGTISTTNRQTLTLGGGNTGNIVLSNLTLANAGLTVSGTTTFSSLGTGVALLSNGVLSAGTVNLSSGTYVSGILPVSNGGSPFEQTNNGAITERITTQDLLLGSTATNSAKFAFINVAGGTPTASISGTGNNALSLNGDGTISTANRQTLTLGGGNTGNIVLANPTTLSSSLTVAGSATFSSLGSGVALLSGGVLSAGTVNLATQVNGILPVINGGSPFEQNLGAISERITTQDVLFGSTATASAKFAFINVAGGTPTASISGANNNALSIDAAGNIFTTNAQTLTIGGASAGNIILSPRNGSGDVRINGTTTLNGSTYTWPNGGQSSGYVLQTNGTGTLFWTNPSSLGTNYWNQVNGVLTPQAETQDLLLGSQATTSAKFAFINVGVGTPTASISGTGNNALSFDGNGNITTTNKQDLTLGSSTTGNINLVLSADNTVSVNGITGKTLGAATCVTTTNGIVTGTGSCTSPSNIYLWTTNAGALIEGNTTMDLLLGSQATTSAKFAVLNVAGGTPVASLSAGTAGGAYLTADGSLQTTSYQKLAIGGASTGDISITAKGGLGGGGTIGLNADALTINNITGKTSVSPTCVSVTNGIVTGLGSCGTGSGGSVWTFNTTDGDLYPMNSTMDLLIGGVSTASAKFAVINVAGGTPVASVSAGTAGAAFISANGNLQTTNKQSLTLGGGNTGNVVVPSLVTGIVHSTNGVLSSAAVNLTGAADITGILPIANGGSPFEQNLGAIIPRIPTQDFLFGGLASSSATFHLFGAAPFQGTNPVASIAANTSFTGLVVDNKGVGDLFTASSSGLSRFVITQNGNVGIGTTLPTQALDIAGNATASGSLRIGSVFQVGGPVASTVAYNRIGNSTTSHGLDASNDLFISGRLEVDGALFVDGSIVSSGTTGTIGWFQRNAGALSPSYITDDLLIGGNASSSALFRVTGNSAFAGTTSVASIAANSSFAGLVVDNKGSGDLFTASSSGLTRFTIKQNGDITLGNLTYTFPSSLADTYVLQTNANGVLSWINPGTLPSSNNFNESNGTLWMKQPTEDLLLGGVSSSSARFHAYGSINSGTTPAASIAANGSFAGLVVDNTGSGDLFTASSSGLTRFTIKQNGNIQIGNLTYTFPSSLADTYVLQTNANGVLSWINPGTLPSSNNFNESNGTLWQKQPTEDLLIGGVSSASARFHAYGSINSGTTPAASISANSNSFAGLVVDNAGRGDIFTASSSGLTRFVINNNGNVGIGTSTAGAPLDVNGAAIATSFDARTATALNIGSTNATGIVIGKLTVSTTIGSVNTQGVALLSNTGVISSGTLDLSSATYVANILGIANGGSPFEQNLGAIIPRIATQDLLIGGVSTASARFHAFGSLNAGTTPSASVAAASSFAGFVVDNSGSGDLFTASSSGTTRFTINQNGNVAIGTPSANYNFEVAGTTAAFNSGDSGALGSWNINPNNMLVNIASGSAVAANGYLYQIGGRDTSGNRNNITAVTFARIKADGSVDQFASTSALPQGRVAHASVALNGYLYTIGGDRLGLTNPNTVLYAKMNSNGTLGTWNNTSSLAVNNASASAVVNPATNTIYVGGGRSGVVQRATQNLDGTLGTWQQQTIINGGSVGAENPLMVLANGFIYFVGGKTNAGASTAVWAAKINPDGSLNNAITTTPLPTALSYVSGGLMNGYIYVIGGENNGAPLTPVATVYYSKIGNNGTLTGGWIQGASIPVTKAGAASTIYNGYIYLMGGKMTSTANSFSASIFYASGARTLMATSLDLIGLTGTGTSLASGSAGLSGSIFAGKIFSNDNLEVVGNTNLWGGLSVNNGITADDIFLSGGSGTSPTASISASSSFAGLLVDNTGAGDLFTASSSGLTRFIITQAGNILPGTDNLQDLGSSPSARFRSLYLGPGSLHIQCRTNDGCSGQSLDYAIGANTSSGNLEIGVNGNTSNHNAKIVLTQGGNVGIGTALPTTKLDIEDTTGTTLRISGTNNNSTSSLQLLENGNANGIELAYDGTNNVLNINDFGGSSLMSVTRTGNVGIGVTGPTEKLQLQRANNTTEQGIKLQSLVGVDWTMYEPAGSDDLRFSNDSTGDTMTLQASSGNVGIGETNPSYKLDVAGSGNGIRIQDNGRSPGDALLSIGDDVIFTDIDVSNTTGLYGQATPAEGGLKLGSGGGTLYGKSGNIGIGTTNPGQILEVDGASGGIGQVRLRNTGSAGGSYWTVGPNTSNQILIIDQNANGVFMTSGFSTWNANSDERLKKNITNLTDTQGLDAIMKLRPVTYNWRTVGGTPTLQYGLIAQEVMNVFPEFVSNGPDTKIQLDDGSTQTIVSPYGLGYTNLITPMIKAIQELNDKVDATHSATPVFQGLSLDGSGNLAVNAGQIQTQALNVSGDLQAQNLTLGGTNVNDKLIGLESGIASVSAGFANPLASLQTQVLSLSDRVASLEGTLASLTASNSALFMNNPLGNFTASTGAELSLDKLTVNGTILADSLSVVHDITTNNLAVNGTITSGLIKINGATGDISTLNGDLKLQDQGLGGIDILDGKVTIDTSGNIQTLGTITAKKLNIDETDTLSASVGQGTIPLNGTNAIIHTTAVTSDSHIFITPRTKTNLQLSVTTQTSGSSFKVEITSPALQPIKFDWFIIN